MAEPSNSVIDISQHNANADLGQAAAAGIVGIIDKTRQGSPTMTRCKSLPPESTRRRSAFGQLITGVGSKRQLDFLLPTLRLEPFGYLGIIS